MPGKPFLQAHGKGVNILVHLLNQRDRLSDWLILAIDISGALSPRERVTKTELSLLNIFLTEVY